MFILCVTMTIGIFPVIKSSLIAIQPMFAYSMLTPLHLI
uniref:Uncharacterized protein n=1 Tax=Arundo donax TaxID=35708 RepID=A0A0A9AY16_ARUDO